MALAEEAAVSRDAEGRFASGGKVALDTLPMEQYSEARENGATTTVEKSEIQEAPKVTGTEKSAKEYNEKRDAQERSKGTGSPKADKRIGKLTKEKYAEGERAERERERADALERELRELKGRNGEATTYETGQPNGDSNAEEPQSQELENYSQSEQREAPPEQRSETPSEQKSETQDREKKFAELRQRLPDFDQAMEKAKNLSIEDISPEAKKVLRESEHKWEMVWLLTKHDELLDALKKEPPELHAEKIKELHQTIEAEKNGTLPLERKVRATLTADELASIWEASGKNQLGSAFAREMANEINALPNGEHVFKELITNPEIVKRFDGMTRARASLELGRISARLEHDSSRVFTSKSPPPIKPVSGGYSGSSVPLDKVQSMREYNAARDRGRMR
jgi:hypothetical protein